MGRSRSLLTASVVALIAGVVWFAGGIEVVGARVPTGGGTLTTTTSTTRHTTITQIELPPTESCAGPTERVLVSEEVAGTETSVTTQTNFGPATILIGEDQSQTHLVPAGATNVNTNTHTETFITQTFAVCASVAADSVLAAPRIVG